MDLDEQFLCIARDSPRAPLEFLEMAQVALGRLSRFSRLGERYRSRNPELSDLRSWPIPGFMTYMIYYRTTEQGIEIVPVLHTKRDFDTIIEEET